MEGGCMLGEVVMFIVIVMMFIATISVGYTRQQYKYHKRAKRWMREYRKNNKR